jgi:TRAP-type C4-dicarboxylate transport system substrate-binding protein
VRDDARFRAHDGRSQAPRAGSEQGEIDMNFRMNRRSALKAAVALAAAAAVPVWAQAKPTLRFAAVFSEKDIRADMMRMLAKDVAADFTIEPFLNASMFKQGTELVALQRDNLEMSNIAPQDFAKQISAWTILTSAYLFRDANHLTAFWSGDLGAQYKKQAEDQVKVKILAPTFFGTRQVGLKAAKKINTPADMAGIKLRMPPGEAWQLLGRSLGANPTPVAFAETYTALQTGAVDGQDNPLPNVQAMKFYEVMSQMVLTSHLIGYDLLTMNLKAWNAMGAAKQKTFQAAVDKAVNWSSAEHLKREAELVETFRKAGLQIYTPNIAAFREHAQKVYLGADEAKDWPKDMLQKIAAIK